MRLVASLVKVKFFSSRRMATHTTLMIPATIPAANRLMAVTAIRTAMADSLVWTTGSTVPGGRGGDHTGRPTGDPQD